MPTIPTIGRINIGGALDGDFDRARRRAAVRRLFAWLLGEDNRLLPFDEAATSGTRPAYAGRRAVETGRIVGSVGRHADFDHAFLPARPDLGERWKRVNRAFRRAEVLPPVRLNKVGGSYFVMDGNHRVSVARFHGVGWIDAEVTEFRNPGEEIACR